MRATVFHGVEDVRVEELPDPRVEEASDVVVRVTHTAVSGSDIRQYRGIDATRPGQVLGRELVGVVAEVGAEVRGLRRGDQVVGPSEWSDGRCAACRDGLTTSCAAGGRFGEGGGPGTQAEFVRVPLGDSTLVRLPRDFNPELLPAAVLASQVMASGQHAAVSARVRYGDTVAVVGDGATGLCAVMAAARLGAERIVALIHHEERAKLAHRFGATDVVSDTGEAAVKAVLDLTGGHGADAVLECVGSAESWQTALAAVRDGGTVGHIGLPLADEQSLHLTQLYRRNVAVRGGIPPTRTYIPGLVDELVRGRIAPMPLLSREVGLAEVGEVYADISARRIIKALVTPALG